MLSKKSQYVLKFLARARHRNSIEKTDNAMYALFGFMNDKVYRIFQRVRFHISMKAAYNLTFFSSVEAQNTVHHPASADDQAEPWGKGAFETSWSQTWTSVEVGQILLFCALFFPVTYRFHARMVTPGCVAETDQIPETASWLEDIFQPRWLQGNYYHC